ncbi:hypothetical protein [Amycolatopsis sp. Hca4]|uniref:hypothetical protein n=1 Tax=unclassified Amycolatopsis TaxID=2618356 RepID=UPI001590C684|nr:hypothetical protein [Amycolatopsis sp. Hca4]QKV79752.1 hypothetical protein HUT10_42615 [Amycolatopsis sp. Hca4]
MTPGVSRRRWHPLTIAAGLVLAAVAAMLALVVAPGALLPGAWLVLCAAAGFATSGST